MAAFLVTGHGRSGTTWCARELDKSPTWRVSHESFTRGVVTEAPKWVMNDLVGTVDSRLRLVALEMLELKRFSKLGVIIRNPIDVYASALGRTNKPEVARRILHNMGRDVGVLDLIAETKSVSVIRFKDMIRGESEFKLFARELGVVDLPGPPDVRPANGPTRTGVPPEVVTDMENRFGWFIEKWDL